MKWFRSNIKHGSRLALVALAIQFALSFGHFHSAAAQVTATPSGQIQSDTCCVGDLGAPDASGPQDLRQPAPNHPDGHSNDTCAICAVMALANAALFTTPPVLLLPQAVEYLYLITDAEFIHLNSAHAAFRPRAPPIS